MRNVNALTNNILQVGIPVVVVGSSCFCYSSSCCSTAFPAKLWSTTGARLVVDQCMVYDWRQSDWCALELFTASMIANS